MQKRELLMLAHVFEPLKHKAEGSYMSEKMDGQRALWLPQTRGMDFQSIIFANTNKDERKHVCSGLWTRYGKPIFAPAWFLDQFPVTHALDGELYAGRGRFQDTASYIKKHTPIDIEWKEVGYYAFDIPSWVRLFEPGRINNPNYAEKIIPPGVNLSLGIDITDAWWGERRYEANWNYLRTKHPVYEPGEARGTWGVLQQDQLPMNRFKAEAVIAERLGKVLDMGGEGLILRRPHSIWQPKRTTEILKVKPSNDAEGTVIGYTYGVGKLYGLVGSVRLRTRLNHTEVEFDLSGFTDTEREIIPEYRDLARQSPAVYTTLPITERYPIGSVITYQYRELTNDGKPKEARYLRPRPEGT